MKALANFEKLKTDKYEIKKAYFTLNGKRVYAAFNSPERLKIYEANGDLTNLTENEIFAACGKHCSSTLRTAICEVLNIEESEMDYQGYVTITDVYRGTDGQKYVNTAENGNQNGSRFFMALKVPKGVEVQKMSQIDKRIIREWEVMASTDSPYKKPLKSFKRNITA